MRLLTFFISMCLAAAFASAQVPPAGVVIPFDTDEGSDDKETNTSKKKQSRREKSSSNSSNETSSSGTPFIETGKPRKIVPKSGELSAKTVGTGGSSQAKNGEGSSTQKPLRPSSKPTKIRSKKRKKAIKSSKKKSKSQTKKKNKASAAQSSKTASGRKQRRPLDPKPPIQKQRRTSSPETPSKSKAHRLKKRKVPQVKATSKSIESTRHRNGSILNRASLEKAIADSQGFDPLSMHDAERVRTVLRGRTEVSPVHIKFDAQQYKVERRQNVQLTALADYLKMTPSVLAVLIYGHVDDSIGPVESSLLGALRAHSVTERLSELGVSKMRLMTISAGKEFPVSAAAEENRRVHFEFVHKGKALRDPDTKMTTASVLRFSGIGTRIRDALQEPLVAPSSIRQGDKISVKTGELAVVLPSGRLMTIQGPSDVTFHRLNWNAQGPGSGEEMEVREGHIKFSLAPAKTAGVTDYTFQVKTPHGRIELASASGTLTITQNGIALELDQGVSTVKLLETSAISISEGQSLQQSSKGIKVHRRLPRLALPVLSVDGKRLTWPKAAGAVSYLVETSPEIHFGWNLKRLETVSPDVSVAEVRTIDRTFARVYARDEFGVLSQASQIISLQQPMRTTR